MRRCLLLVLALLALPGAASAQSLADYDYEFLRFRGIGLGGGYLWSEKVENTQEYHLRLDLGYLGPGVRIIPSVSYWSSRYRTEELQALADRMLEAGAGRVQASELGPIEWSDLALSIDGHFVWNTPFDVLTFVGAGLGFHALNGDGPAIDDTFVEDLLDAITAAASGIAGFELEPVERLRLYVEGRYTAMNSIQFLSARAGLQFMFIPSGATRVGSAVPAPPLVEETGETLRNGELR